MSADPTAVMKLRGETAERLFAKVDLQKKDAKAVQALLEVVDVHLVHALEDDEVVLVALVVTEKQVLAVRGLELAPVGQRLLNGAQRRVELDVELNA